ncbi:MAG: hypothetical protein WDO15_06290 [Bacteroidota bacterium]
MRIRGDPKKPGDAKSAIDPKMLFQVDFKSDLTSNSINMQLAGQIRKAIVLMQSIYARPQESNLTRFKDAFVKKIRQRRGAIARSSR